jgi:hypothetical protein
MNKNFYIRLRDNKAIILDSHDRGISMGVHIMGGHITLFLNKSEALEVLKAVQAIMEDNPDN